MSDLLIIVLGLFLLMIVGFAFIEIIEELLGLFKMKNKEYKEAEIRERKREMCKRAIQSGVCPHICEICAWNVGE